MGRDVAHISFPNKRGKEANAMAENLADSPGYGRIGMHQRAVKGVLWGRQEAQGKAKVRGEAGFLGWARSSFDLHSEVVGGSAVSMCRGEVPQN